MPSVSLYAPTRWPSTCRIRPSPGFKEAAVSGGSFDDVAADAYYVSAVTWAVSKGITNGTDERAFSPDTPVTRAQAVTFLYRELG